ncbi:DnaB-like helicase N-terminal domain-containing protein [Streptomyces sp. NPDC051642]|uniref:DnaB-like helicase N-terminal domain-containing protein n=1 Tax=Streptomyces sp. NPDC051642 TaxID=3154646 RepID=UPI00344A80E3
MPTQRTALYRLLAASGRLLYVGISNNPDFRWSTHSNNQPWWPEVADRKIEWFDSREDASAAEIEAIKEERPLYNKQHSVVSVRSSVPSSISTLLEDPWADSGPSSALPAARRQDCSGSDRVPPQDIDAEQSVLGCMMLTNEVVSDVAAVLTGTDFCEDSHKTIYAAILDLWARAEPADRITVAALLTKRGHITKVGGGTYLHALVGMVPTAANAKYYAEIVYERAVMRRMIHAGARLMELGNSFQVEDAAEMLRLARAELDIVAGPLRTEAAVRSGLGGLLELPAPTR